MVTSWTPGVGVDGVIVSMRHATNVGDKRLGLHIRVGTALPIMIGSGFLLQALGL